VGRSLGSRGTQPSAVFQSLAAKTEGCRGTKLIIRPTNLSINDIKVSRPKNSARLLALRGRRSAPLAGSGPRKLHFGSRGTGTGESAQSALAALSARNLNSGQNSTNVRELYRTKNAFTEIQINFFGLQVVILQCIVFVPHRPSRLFGLSIHSYTETSYDGSPEIDACFALTASSR
jgi:hypothetical protein